MRLPCMSFSIIECLCFSLRLKLFEKFENTADALDNAAALVEGKVAPKLANLLKSLDEKSGSLIVSDPKLGILPPLNIV